MILEKVFEQRCQRCDRKQLAGATVFLPFKREPGKKPWFPPAIVCASCRPAASKEWHYQEAVVVA